MRLLILFCSWICLSSAALAQEPPASPKSAPVQSFPDYSTYYASPPPVAARFHQCGTVVLSVLLDRGGYLQNLNIASSSGFPQLDLDAVREAQTVYFPPLGKDEPDTAWKQVQFVFPPTSDLPPDKADQWSDDVPLVPPGGKMPPGYDAPTSNSSKVHSFGGGYPVIARRLNEQGDVIVEYEVGTDGWVHNDRITKSSGWPLLDAEALIGVEFWHFDHPATKNGVPAPIRNQMSARFKLEN